MSKKLNQKETTNLQRTFFKNKIKQLTHNQPRSRTQKNYRGSINLIHIHIEFLKPLLNCTNQSLHKNKKQRYYSFSPRTLLTSVSFFLYKKTETNLWLWISKLSSFLALCSVQLNALIKFSPVCTLYNSQKP